MTKPRDFTGERMRENLKRFIDESGYSQNQVADMSGIPQASLGRYIRGENALPANALKLLSEVFGCSVDDFYSTEPPHVDVESAPPVFLRHRPGAEWTDEDQKKADQFFADLQTRRGKKPPRRKT